jgi:hypothetical protein
MTSPARAHAGVLNKPAIASEPSSLPCHQAIQRVSRCTWRRRDPGEACERCRQTIPPEAERIDMDDASLAQRGLEEATGDSAGTLRGSMPDAGEQRLLDEIELTGGMQDGIPSHQSLRTARNSCLHAHLEKAGIEGLPLAFYGFPPSGEISSWVSPWGRAAASAAGLR